MKRNTKIIQIEGIRGILTAGFVAFPGYVAMNTWNYFAGTDIPQLTLYQGILLWAIIFLAYFIASKRSVVVCLKSPQELSDEEMNILMERVRLQSEARRVNQIMLKNLEEIKKEEASKDSEQSEDKTIIK